DIEAADRAVLEIGKHGAAEVRHDGALAVAGGAHADLRLQLAVELVEVGGTLQQRQRTHTDQIAGQRVNRLAPRRIDDELAADLAAIGPEIRKSAPQDTAGERGVDRDRRETRLAN